METWAHGQEVFDALGLDRAEADRIKNIVVLGMNTFGWTYAVRKLDIPATVPQVRLTAPSGAEWVWNEHEPDNTVEGSGRRVSARSSRRRATSPIRLCA